MNEADFAPTIERFTGFGFAYDQMRPSPPKALAEFLAGVARCTTPSLVVDLGCGTGLSTRYWSGRAKSVIGIEPTDSMREQAERTGGAQISYRKGYSHATNLPDECADIVTCSQALHWMDPVSTFHESARILRTGGVFCAYDYDWPPSTLFWQVDRAYTECMELVRGLEREHGIAAKLTRWDKTGHLARMEESRAFRYVRETVLHHEETGGAERIVGVFLSQGHVRSLLKLGLTRTDLGVDRLQEVANAAFGSSVSKWLWSSRVRIGIK